MGRPYEACPHFPLDTPLVIAYYSCRWWTICQMRVPGACWREGKAYGAGEWGKTELQKTSK